MAEKELKVGIGDMKFARGDSRIITYALGSCVGITFYDPAIRLGALLHVMLPARVDPNDARVFKYADSGIHETIRKLTAFGMMKNRTIVKKVLLEERLRIAAEDTGGTYARTMLIDVANGNVVLRTVGRPEKCL